MKLLCNPCRKFRVTFGRTQFAKSTLLTSTMVLCDLLRSVQMLKREWNAESNGKLPHIIFHSKTPSLFPEFGQDCNLGFCVCRERPALGHKLWITLIIIIIVITTIIIIIKIIIKVSSLQANNSQGRCGCKGPHIRSHGTRKGSYSRESPGTHFYRSTSVVQRLSYSLLDPRFAASNPAGVGGFFQRVKILSMTFFLEVKYSRWSRVVDLRHVKEPSQN